MLEKGKFAYEGDSTPLSRSKWDCVFLLLSRDTIERNKNGKNKVFNPTATLTKCIHQNAGNETTRMKPFLAISFYLYADWFTRSGGARDR